MIDGIFPRIFTTKGISKRITLEIPFVCINKLLIISIIIRGR